jgi:hypothetical protein
MRNRIVYTPILDFDSEFLSVLLEGCRLNFPVLLSEVDTNLPVTLIVEYHPKGSLPNGNS